MLLVLLLTFGVVGGWIFRIPATLTGLPSSLFLLGIFAVFFLIASVWASRQVLGDSLSIRGNLLGNISLPGNFAVQLPALSAILPFLLLIMVTLRLPVANPSAVFAWHFSSLFCSWAWRKSLRLMRSLPSRWRRFWPATRPGICNTSIPVTRLFRSSGISSLPPSSASFHFFPSAVRGPNRRLGDSGAGRALTLFLIYDLVRRAHPNGMLGLLPAAFAVPSLLGMLSSC